MRFHGAGAEFYQWVQEQGTPAISIPEDDRGNPFAGKILFPSGGFTVPDRFGNWTGRNYTDPKKVIEVKRAYHAAYYERTRIAMLELAKIAKGWAGQSFGSFHWDKLLWGEQPQERDRYGMLSTVAAMARLKEVLDEQQAALDELDFEVSNAPEALAHREAQARLKAEQDERAMYYLQQAGEIHNMVWGNGKVRFRVKPPASTN